VSQTVTAGSGVSFSVVATGVPAPTYLWSFDGSPIAGATGSTYALNNVQSASAGTYTVLVSNRLGSATSNPASLTVNPIAAPVASSGSGGGGGGAPSLWFCSALSLLVLMTRMRRRS
jgi:hypothetical protein